tara:strand:+ start:197 stop:523 length:327 start_codon:yes stop_codon:yes gene_type:complete
MKNPVTRKIEGSHPWELVEDWGVLGETIPKGLKFNGASIPKWLQWLIKPDGSLFIASIYHDFMLRNGLLTKYQVDWGFYKLARKTGANLLLSVSALIAVLIFSRGNYD